MSAPVFDIQKPLEYHKIGFDLTRGDADYIMSCSQLKEFSENPRKWLVSPRQLKTRATTWGSLVDCMTLTPDEFDRQFMISPYPAFQSNEAKNWKSTVERDGFIVVKKPDCEEASKAVKRMQEDNLVGALLKFSRKQVCVRWEYKDEETGLVVPLKSLIDLLPNKPANSLGDLKTTADGSPSKWERTIVDYAYHAQAAMYLDGVNQALGEERDEFFHIVSESEAPYEFEPRRLSEQYITIGRLWYRNQLARYCKCVTSGNWPSWGNEPMPVVEPPLWLIS